MAGSLTCAEHRCEEGAEGSTVGSGADTLGAASRDVPGAASGPWATLVSCRTASGPAWRTVFATERCPATCL